MEAHGAAELGDNGTVISTTLTGSGSFQAVFGGGSYASATTISSGADQAVYYGTASGTVILSGGVEEVGEYNDPTARPKSISALVSGGEQDVRYYGSTIGTTIYAGSEVVSTGGTAIDTQRRRPYCALERPCRPRNHLCRRLGDH
jgi:fibronectin-binding autotransporter adhesin